MSIVSILLNTQLHSAAGIAVDSFSSKIIAEISYIMMYDISNISISHGYAKVTGTNW